MLRFLFDTDQLIQCERQEASRRVGLINAWTRLLSSREMILLQSDLRIETTILPGHRLEIIDPDLPQGATVRVIVLLPEPAVPPGRSVLEILKSLPPGPLLFETPADADH